jgi:hypothetical protein
MAFRDSPIREKSDMRRVVLILAAAVTAAATAACGGGDIAVLAQLDGAATGTQETEAVALSSLPIRLLPFDRDVVFDSLAEAYPEPEPEVPDSIFELQQRVQDRYLTYQQANTRWATLRDSLQTLSDRMQRMDQGSGEYFALYQEFNDMEGEVNTLETRANDAFEEFTTLQSRLNAQSQEITLARRAWADEAFTSVDSIFAVRLEELGREERWDTTDAQGMVRFRGVPSGDWWVSARYDRQFDELYWNEPIEVGGEEITVRLTEENAEVRQNM